MVSIVTKLEIISAGEKNPNILLYIVGHFLIYLDFMLLLIKQS